MTDSRPKIDCKWCGTPTPMLGTKMCDGCWELDTRIRHDLELASRIVLDCLADEGQHWAMLSDFTITDEQHQKLRSVFSQEENDGT